MAKIPVVKVWLNRAEGPIRETGQRTFTSLSAADQQLKRWATSAPKKGGGYDKTDFKVEWADGETYEGRYDLQREDSGKTNLLGSHIQHYLNFHTGMLCPEHMTSEDYDRYLEQAGCGPGSQKRSDTIAFLQNYEM